MRLKFGDVEREASVRKAADMAEVIFDKEWLEKNLDAELYYMFRDLWMDEDRETILRNRLRYDITIIPPRKMGVEFVKTQGHYHPECCPNLTYPEIYEVQEGKAHYLLQRKEKGKIIDVILIEAEAGDKVIIPPNYGHVTINPTDEPLRMANWVSRDFTSLYQEFNLMGGAAYFELIDGRFIKNPKYGEIPELRFGKPSEIPELEIVKGKEMYELIKRPENLAFLNHPEKFLQIFEKCLK
ncbi:MAG: glucose-6-phosphate isomerase family protein [Candidatus Hadarchaeales archaeon]